MKRQSLLLVLLMLLCGMRMQAQLLSVKTDALWDVAMTPNLGLEIVTGEKTSVNASVFGNSHPWGLKVKMLGVMPEFRYWFNGRPMTRTFVGVSAVGLSYDVTWGHENYDGDAYGLGLTFGLANLGDFAGVGPQNGRLLLTLGHQNLRLLFAFGLQNGLTALALRLHLLLHGVLNLARRQDVLELHAVDPDAPGVGGLVQDDSHAPVDVVAAGQRLVEL